jgi:hypothetical protein
VRAWERKDITDILKDHHRELVAASVALSEGGDHEGSDKIDDDVLVIEHYLETERNRKHRLKVARTSL